jgi:hypothetical protein
VVHLLKLSYKKIVNCVDVNESFLKFVSLFSLYIYIYGIEMLCFFVIMFQWFVLNLVLEC